MTEEPIYLAGETEETEATLVAPRFDERAEETARPVIPLSEEAVAEASSVRAGGFGRSRFLTAARPSWLVALLVASLLVGTVLGGFGLRLYQRHRAAAAAAPAPDGQQSDTSPETSAETQPQAANEMNQTADAGAPALTPPVEVLASGEAENSAQAGRPDGETHDEAHGQPARDEAHRKEAAEEKPRAPERDAAKKQSEPQTVVRETRHDDDRPAPSDGTRPRRVETPQERRRELKKEAEYDVEQEPRMIGRITYGRDGRTRRERRRTGQSAPPVDRVRGIFEGVSPR